MQNNTFRVNYYIAQFRTLSDKAVANAMEVTELPDSDMGSVIDVDPEDPFSLPSGSHEAIPESESLTGALAKLKAVCCKIRLIVDEVKVYHLALKTTEANGLTYAPPNSEIIKAAVALSKARLGNSKSTEADDDALAAMYSGAPSSSSSSSSAASSSSSSSAPSSKKHRPLSKPGAVAEAGSKPKNPTLLFGESLSSSKASTIASMESYLGASSSAASRGAAPPPAKRPKKKQIGEDASNAAAVNSTPAKSATPTTASSNSTMSRSHSHPSPFVPTAASSASSSSVQTTSVTTSSVSQMAMAVDLVHQWTRAHFSSTNAETELERMSHASALPVIAMAALDQFHGTRFFATFPPSLQAAAKVYILED